MVVAANLCEGTPHVFSREIRCDDFAGRFEFSLAWVYASIQQALSDRRDSFYSFFSGSCALLELL